MKILLVNTFFIFSVFLLSSPVFAEEGSIEFKDGSIYRGELNNGEMTGIGFLEYPRTDSEYQVKYEGEFLNGEFNLLIISSEKSFQISIFFIN